MLCRAARHAVVLRTTTQKMAERGISIYKARTSRHFQDYRKNCEFRSKSNEDNLQNNTHFQMQLEFSQREPEISLLLSKKFGSDLVNLFSLTIYCLARKFEVLLSKRIVKMKK